MGESVAVAKEADAKKSSSSTCSSNKSSQFVRDEREGQLGYLWNVIGNIRSDGHSPSVESIATQLSSIHSAQRASVLLALQQTHGNRYVQRMMVSGIQEKLMVGQPGEKYKQEANRILEQDMWMPEPIAGADILKQTMNFNIQNNISNPILQRLARGRALIRRAGEGGSELTEEEVQQLSDTLCIGITPGEGPTRCSFTDLQGRRVRLTKRLAWELASRSALALSSGDQYITRLAQRIFHISNPDIPEMVSTLNQIRKALWYTAVECGTCADDTCNMVIPGSGGTRTAPAYVPEDFSSIVICPYFFRLTLLWMKRTFLHEAGHIVHIDDRPNYEHPPYCTEDDRVECDDPCAGLSNLLHNVDAWARFIECAAYSY